MAAAAAPHPEKPVAAAEARAVRVEGDVGGHAAALRRAIAAEAKVLVAEELQRRAEAKVREAEARARAADGRAVAAEAALAAAQQATAAVMMAKVAADARANAAEARAAAAEAAAAEALAEVQRVRESEAQRQAECEGLRASLQGIREAGRCPILQGMMRDPVVASDGQTYDRQAIVPWLRQHRTSPMTRDPLQQRLYPNRFAAAVLQQLGEIGLGTSEVGDGDYAEGIANSNNPQDAADPEPGELQEAINRRDEARALELLERPRLPGLDAVDQNGNSVLHLSIIMNLPAVASAIAARDDFSGINSKDRWCGTALHVAARLGSLEMCRIVLEHDDFTELQAKDMFGGTPQYLALRFGHRDVAEFLSNAVAQHLS